jgi:hypothetical protein
MTTVCPDSGVLAHSISVHNQRQTFACLGKNVHQALECRNQIGGGLRVSHLFPRPLAGWADQGADLRPNA